MQMIVFLVEVILIFLWLKWEEVSEVSTQLISQEVNYSSYSSFDLEGYEILSINQLSKTKKLEVFKHSSLMKEIQYDFPHLPKMIESIERSLDDTSNFKSELIEYMEFWHSEYVAGNISDEKLKTMLFSPQSLIINY